MEELSQMHKSVVGLYKVALKRLVDTCIDPITGEPIAIPDSTVL